MAHRIIIAGGTGFLGHSLISFFKQKENVSLVILTRGKSEIKNNISNINWNVTGSGSWTETLKGSTAVINLVGKSVNCRYTKKNKQEIVRSRVDAIIAIGKAIQQAAKPPGVWINAGSAAIFGNGGDEIKTESSATGDGFSAEVCEEWEQAFNNVATDFTRKVIFRIGLVFQRNRGLLLPFVNLVKAGMGGRIGSGRQYISWIHEADFTQVIYEALVNENMRGIINCSSPFPVTNQHFMSALRKVLRSSVGLPNPSALVKIGGLLIGTEAELVLTGRRVIPARLLQDKFVFQYPLIEDALNHLLDKK